MKSMDVYGKNNILQTVHLFFVKFTKMQMLILASFVLAACEDNTETATAPSSGPYAATPVVNGLSPVSPANNNNITVSGTSGANFDIGVFINSNCATVVATTVADGAGNWSVNIIHPDNKTYRYYAKAFDGTLFSKCSSTSVQYKEDSTAPAKPSVTSTLPASPSGVNNIDVKGVAEANSIVDLYSDSSCLSYVASGTAAANYTFSIPVTVSDNTSNVFYAQSTDPVGNVSVCSTSFVTYVEDSDPPVSPTVDSSSPLSPSNVNTPTISGTGTAGTSVKLYSDAACLSLLGSGTINGSGIYSVVLNLPSNSTTDIYAQSSDGAGNQSGCSAVPLSYIEDSVKPVVTIGGVSPASPSSDNNPTVTGTTETNIAITIYSNSTCTTVLDTSTADGSGNFSFARVVNDNTTNRFYLRSQDLAGNKSNCSAAITYVHDNLAPNPPVFTASSPVSPSNNNSPTISGTAEANATVNIFDDAACTNLLSSVTANSSGVFSYAASVAADATSEFYGTVSDAVGNESACSTSFLSYIEDSTVPNVPTVGSTSPASPSGNNSPFVIGTADPSTSVRLYSDSSCTTFINSGTSDGGGNFVISITVANDSSTDVYAAARDAASNQSACSSTFVSYDEVSTPPAVPSLNTASPASPSNDSTPNIIGTAQANVTILLYSDSACSTQIGTGASDGAGDFSVVATLATDGVSEIYTRAEKIGNYSTCSVVPFFYVLDTTPPSVPAWSGVAPVSPANNNNPVLSGSTSPNVAVRLYSDASCTTFLTEVNSNGGGVFSFNRTVTDNTSNSFYALSRDSVGNDSACSAVITYVEDSTPPSMPLFTSTFPVSPSDNNNPDILGTAENNSIVRLYSDSGCTTLVDTATATGGNFTTSASVGDNSTVSFYATAQDAAGNTSSCTVSPASYSAYSIGEGVAFMTGTETTAPSTPTNLNQATAYPIKWNVSYFHSDRYSHSRTTNNHQLTVLSSGNYRLALTLPHTGAVTRGSLVAQVRINGVAHAPARGNSYIRNTSGHAESSVNLTVLLPNLVANDVIDVTVGLTGAAGTITTYGNASLFVEYLGARPVFYATATQTTNSTNLNQATAYPLMWASTIVDSDFIHNNSSNQQDIQINSSGTYMAYINIPLSGAVARANVRGTIKKNGTAIAGGLMKQGYISNTSGHTESTLYWAGILNGLVSTDIITVETALEAVAGTITVPAGVPASIYIEKLSSNAGVYSGRGTALSLNSNWNNGTAQSATWTVDDLYDNATYTHATGTNPHQVTIAAAGDYMLNFNVGVSAALANSNFRITVKVNNVAVSGANTMTNYIENTSGHTESSSALVYYLRNLAANDIVTVEAIQEAFAGTMSSDTDSKFSLVKIPTATTP